MVFNWFRRQNKKSSDSSSEQKQEQEKVENQVSTESTEESTPAQTTEDLLAFAKAAYKNIQDKQQTTESTEESTSETSAEVEEAVSEEVSQSLEEDTEVISQSEEVIESPQEDTEVVSQSEEVIESPEQDSEVISQSEEVSEENTQSQVEEPNETDLSEVKTSDAEVTEPEVIYEVETEDVPQPTAPANLSFLERAKAEREAKQERLVASAIEVTETSQVEQPALVSNDTSEPAVEETSELEFDEGFLWSTEVLAAQGRRAEDVSIEEINWLKKLRQGLDKTRRSIVNQLKAIVGKGPLNADAVDEIEALLLQADVGIEATDYIISSLQEKLRQEALPPEEGIAYLKKILRDILDKPLQESPESASFTPEKENFNIWLMTGVNGAGKTTTIGKIAHLANKSGYNCLIGAADTFRAAAVQQVKVWGERSGVEVIANPGKNTDPAAVVFDAIAAAQSRGTELLLVDTAGRLQNKKNLMEELSKIRRIINKKAPDAKVESLLVLDATLGQNGLRQAEVFSQAAELSGVVLTKLDGTAKGGVALAVVQQLGLPIRFIGAGEGMEDLRPFSSYEFVEALLSG
ncbi:MAG: signal recognition particle-docking protein FtsY [Rivularia sp. ALOHA_DT_140]|nr:signal recognition particle-docking protein FtsY [Rivularia sp. ALOHA_DT_140]